MERLRKTEPQRGGIVLAQGVSPRRWRFIYAPLGGENPNRRAKSVNYVPGLNCQLCAGLYMGKNNESLQGRHSPQTPFRPASKGSMKTASSAEVDDLQRMKPGIVRTTFTRAFRPALPELQPLWNRSSTHRRGDFT